MLAALSRGEFGAVEMLINNGAKVDIPVAAASGRIHVFEELLTISSSENRHLAFAYAVQHGNIKLVKMLLNAGEDPNRYNPQGAHPHSEYVQFAGIGAYLRSG